MADQCRRLQILVCAHRCGERLHGRVELIDPVDGADLRELRGHLRVVHGIERVLLLQLRHQQFEKRARRIVAAQARRSAGRTRRTARAEHVGQRVGVDARRTLYRGHKRVL